MTKERVLFVGQHPDMYVGNGNMLYKCLEQVDREKYDICAFVQGEVSIELMTDPFQKNEALCNYISATSVNDGWGKQKLLNALSFLEFDQLIFVGIDIWRYAELFDHIDRLKASKNFVWKVIVPYDLTHIRQDWIKWLQRPDHVFVYSEYGHTMLKDHIKNLSYFRPTVRDEHLYQPLSEDERAKIKKQVFPDVSDDMTVFGFIGANQIRKNILRTLRGFAKALKKRKEAHGKEDMLLYMHMDTMKGIFDVEQIVRDLGIPDGLIRHNGQSRKLQPIEMATLYKIFDAHLLFSLQEGLSWTVIESKLTGTPSLLSNNTAHLDYTQGVLSCFPDTEDMLPLMTENGPAYVQAEACSSDNISHCISKFMFKYKDKGKEKQLRLDAARFGKQWTDASDDISKVLEYEVEKTISGEEI